jgi:hypothetical protein
MKVSAFFGFHLTTMKITADRPFVTDGCQDRPTADVTVPRDRG